MSGAVPDDEILRALEAAGLTEVYRNEDGQEAVRLTDEGAALAGELGIMEHGDAPTEVAPDEPSAPALDLRHSWGTAVGAAMLGFEQALRTEPPPETVAAEQVPERGSHGLDRDTVLVFPDEAERGHR
jgi:hypothetical protein